MAISNDLPLSPGYVQMAWPPPGGELVQAVFDRCDIVGYERVRVRQCEVTEEEDLWARTDDMIPGEFQCELAIGDFRTRNAVDFIVELMNVSPIQYASLALAMSAVALDQADLAVRN
jgi:hypothetical protein